MLLHHTVCILPKSTGFTENMRASKKFISPPILKLLISLEIQFIPNSHLGYASLVKNMSIETQCIYHKFAKNKNPPLSSYSTTPYSNIPHRLHSFSITNQHLRIFFKTPLISQCQHILTAEQIFKLKLNKFFHKFFHFHALIFASQYSVSYAVSQLSLFYSS